ncbi:hypothetical protein DAT35_32240 [Vitiosangium sp. GDMCC 1.1324]|nr:hypothetical protein DAT35_32240 [Vitiosangium sp. GDMCC 1.1324]
MLHPVQHKVAARIALRRTIEAQQFIGHGLEQIDIQQALDVVVCQICLGQCDTWESCPWSLGLVISMARVERVVLGRARA